MGDQFTLYMEGVTEEFSSSEKCLVYWIMESDVFHDVIKN